VLGVVQGETSAAGRTTELRDGPLTVLPPLLLLLISLVMGLAMPTAILNLVKDAADYVGGSR
jgi:hypothetical protein